MVEQGPGDRWRVEAGPAVTGRRVGNAHAHRPREKTSLHSTDIADSCFRKGHRQQLSPLWGRRGASNRSREEGGRL